jgi:hypothetical protein
MSSMIRSPASLAPKAENHLSPLPWVALYGFASCDTVPMVLISTQKTKDPDLKGVHGLFLNRNFALVSASKVRKYQSFYLILVRTNSSLLWLQNRIRMSKRGHRSSDNLFREHHPALSARNALLLGIIHIA